MNFIVSMTRLLALFFVVLAACGGGSRTGADEIPDGCVPVCDGRQCGADGCGGVCGTCAADDVCTDDGRCGAACGQACDGRDCGPDGCGGDCGTCGEGLTCDAAGAGVCVPACDDRECGPDGCGGGCGACPTNHECDAAGVCVGVQVSINCPPGQVCMIYEYSAYQYACTAAPGGGMDCTVTGVIATFPNAWSCRNACRGGALKCAADESKPSSDPLIAACLACLDSCKQGAPLQCSEEVEGGCLWNGQLVYDGETVVCDCR
ncbi:MAG: hypothetical protein HY897_16775 [Deltaproteobacteria bacterium]|nr:hypothetical protein [Deltaproteobacteria bacterium]